MVKLRGNHQSLGFILVIAVAVATGSIITFASGEENLLILGFLLASIAASADLLGGYLSVVKQRLSENQLTYFIALAAGFILGAVLLERIPAVIHSPDVPEGMLLVLSGFMTLLLIENFFAGHAHHLNLSKDDGEPHGSHALVGSLSVTEPLISSHASYTALVGLLIHTFFDGAAIVAGFLISAKVGAILFLAVMLHKVPEGLSMSSIMLAAGKSRSIAFRSAAAIGLSTVIGGIAPSIIQSTPIVEAFLAIASGTFLYISTVNLIPAVNEGKNRKALAVMVLGILLFFVSARLLEFLGFE